MSDIPKYPAIEKRIGKKGERYYVVGVPSFEGAQLYGFKTEDSLMRCWVWWYNNTYLKHQSGKLAKKEWKSGGKENFYNKHTPTPTPIKPVCTPKDINPDMKVTQPVYLDVPEEDVPNWMN